MIHVWLSWARQHEAVRLIKPFEVKGPRIILDAVYIKDRVRYVYFFTDSVRFGYLTIPLLRLFLTR